MPGSPRTKEVAGRRQFAASSESTSDATEPVQVSDQALLDLMRSEDSYGVGELAERLQVTDTAIRQRLTRLMDRGFVQRAAVREGRGRPKHVYCLTEAGVRESGANLEDLAVALWQEVVELDDTVLRERLIVRVVDRLAKRYAVEVSGHTPTERMRSVVDLFNRRGIPFSLEGVGEGKPRLKVLGCPYPGLVGSSTSSNASGSDGSAGHDRYVCLMEHMLFQRLIGSDVESISCDSSKSGCCEFVPLSDGTQAPAASHQNGDSANTEHQNSNGKLTITRSACSSGHCHCRDSGIEATDRD